MIGITVLNAYKHCTSDEESIEDGKPKAKQLTSSVLRGTQTLPITSPHNLEIAPIQINITCTINSNKDIDIIIRIPSKKETTRFSKDDYE
jgi:hypothetical protein